MQRSQIQLCHTSINPLQFSFEVITGGGGGGGGGGGIEGQMQMGHQTAPTYVAKIWQFGASILWYIVIMPNYSLAQLTTKDLEDLIGKTKATLLEVVNESKTSLLRIESELKKV